MSKSLLFMNDVNSTYKGSCIRTNAHLIAFFSFWQQQHSAGIWLNNLIVSYFLFLFLCLCHLRAIPSLSLCVSRLLYMYTIVFVSLPLHVKLERSTKIWP